MCKLPSIVIVLLLSFNALAAKSPHGEKFRIKCDVCHNPEGWAIKVNSNSFDHAQTNFPLVGQHKAVDCRKCHDLTSGTISIGQGTGILSASFRALSTDVKVLGEYCHPSRFFQRTLHTRFCMEPPARPGDLELTSQPGECVWEEDTKGRATHTPYALHR